MRTTAIAIATGLGLGYMPKAPGTFGTLLGIPIFIGMVHLPWWAYLLVLVAIIAIASWASGITAAHYGEDDCQKIVVDEVAGYVTTMFLAPLTWQHALVGFIFFRLFDITKPWPASYFDRNVHSGFGVVMDDIAAGAYACGAMHLCAYVSGVLGYPWI